MKVDELSWKSFASPPPPRWDGDNGFNCFRGYQAQNVWETLTMPTQSTLPKDTRDSNFHSNLYENLWFLENKVHGEADKAWGGGDDWPLRYIMAFSFVKGYYSRFKFNSRKGVHLYSVPHFREIIFVSPLTVMHTAAEICPPATTAFRNLSTSVQQHSSLVCPALRHGYESHPLLLILAWAPSILSLVFPRYQTFSTLLKTACHRTPLLSHTLTSYLFHNKFVPKGDSYPLCCRF
jgi:hypothetical protein